MAKLSEVTATQNPTAESAEQVKAEQVKRPPAFMVGMQSDPDNLVRVEAANANDAWAKFCDSRKSWPSPRLRIVKPA